MSFATSVVNNTPIFGRMIYVDKSTGLEEINAWPALMIMSSFIWLVVAGILGLFLPATQIFQAGEDHYYTAMTLHAAALVFPFSVQLMMGVGLHRSGGCVGKAITGFWPAMTWLTMNLGSAILTVAVLMGLKVSLMVMFPLPLVGAQMGVWSMDSVIVGFTGIYLVLASMILFYPILIFKMMFWGRKRPELILSERSLNDPGMLGMILSAMVLFLTGLPLVVVGTTLLLALYKILPMSMAAWAADPVVFQYSFFFFAHNLMEAMAIMVASAIYATLPLYLADGSRKLISDKMANLALWILLVTSITSGLHHFITFYPNQPAALSYWGSVMSWSTGIGVALSIFTIFATIWKHGLKPEVGLIATLIGWGIYIFDGASAMVTSSIAWAYQLHGTMWQSGHTMTVVLSMALMWMGILYHHYPVITGRKLDPALGRLYVWLMSIGAIGVAAVMLMAGADGMPRRIADWHQENWMFWGNLFMFFGLILGAAFVVYLYNLMKSSEITATMGRQLARA